MALVTSAIERLGGLRQSARQAFSPLLAVEEQGNGLIDASLAGVGVARQEHGTTVSWVSPAAWVLARIV
jgi:hypothetical protein